MYILSTEGNRNNVDAFAKEHKINEVYRVAMQEVITIQRDRFPDEARYILVYVDNNRSSSNNEFGKPRVKRYAPTPWLGDIADTFMSDVYSGQLNKTRVVVIDGYGTILGIVIGDTALEISQDLTDFHHCISGDESDDI